MTDSGKTLNVPSSPLEKIQLYQDVKELAAATGAIDLSIGYQQTSLMPQISEILSSLSEPAAHSYTQLAGQIDLRKAICGYVKRTQGIRVDPEYEILVTCGCNAAISMAVFSLSSSKDTILTFSPYYNFYESIAQSANCKLKTIPYQLEEDRFRIDLCKLESAIDGSVRAIILNSPSNPTGLVISQEEYSQINQMCQKHDVYLISDEVYQDFIYEPELKASATILLPDSDNVMITSSVSKIFGLTGWRVGWLIGSKELIEKATYYHASLNACAPSILQIAAASLLNRPAFSTDLEEQRILLKKKRDILFAALLDYGLDVFKPSGGFFITAGIERSVNKGNTLFSRLLSDNRVAALPLYHKGSKELLRFSFCVEDSMLGEGVRRLVAK